MSCGCAEFYRRRYPSDFGKSQGISIERPKPRRLYPYGLFTQDEVFTAENQRVKSYAVSYAAFMTPARVA